MCSSLPILKRSRALPRFTVGCREIAAASLSDGGTCLIVGVCAGEGGHSLALGKEHVATAASK